MGAILLTACEGMEITGPDTFDRPNDKWQQVDKERESIFGEGGLSFGGADEKRKGQGGTGIGVNAFLWRATLDTVSFMPLASADPFGGVILTDWHSTSNSPNERYKLNIYIIGQALRADGIRVAAFRQVKNGANEWQSVAIDPKAVTDIENAILTRARQLRSESMTQ
ncbi:DUF3576 domain-containing protein [Terasakiella sp. SH-1]|uniref:DUF3576 domain-containing protein n=1 Tax=Terasakiella sp. SH-1 TaxID=2560057 RepID=UPI001F0CF574|nr:DUF3576 domain-containing protein [Terasakiella sp. SH-1]